MNLNAEYIVCSAIWFDDKKKYENPHCKPRNIFTGYVIAGLRHANCLAIYNVLTHNLAPKSGIKQIQGFLTSYNRFVDRAEASKIAIRAEQFISTEDDYKLTSEDLY